MTYDNMGGIVQKNQTASLNYPGYPGEKYNYYYTLGNTSHPHATSKIWDRRNHKQYTYGFDNNGNPTITHEQYAPPLQGQPNPSGPIDLIQENYWDEQNQLRGLWNLAGLHHYIYDADGQRLMKSSVRMSHSAVNAQSLQATNTIPSVEYTVYVSAGLVYESDGTSESYTKHYYAGPLRVASQIGSGNPNYETHPTSGGNLAQGGPVSATAPTNGLAVLGDLNSMLANYGMSVSPTAPPTDTIAMQVVYHPTECDQFYAADLIERNRCLCDNFPDYALSKGIDCSPYTPIYWYHPDYIGNVEFVTDRTGQPYQHFYYAAFGDPMVSQHVGTGSFNSAFRFNAKEYDEETGNYYYGARYYEPKSSIWMGVDALATSYPGMNPYKFTMGNPIMAIDPDGNWLPGKGFFRNLFYSDQRIEAKDYHRANPGSEIRRENNDWIVTVYGKDSDAQLNTFATTEISVFTANRDRKTLLRWKLGDGNAWSLQLSGTLAVGPWGQNATLGFGIDGNDDWFWIGSDGLSMGLDASIGISSSLYLPYEDGEIVTINDLKGYGRSNAFGFGILDGESGGDDKERRFKNDLLSTYRNPRVNKYREETCGLSLGLLPVAYTHNFSYTDVVKIR